MRDKPESTPINEKLPEVIAARLRSARLAQGLSQDAVAKEMNALGFSTWRQTTVAKTEAADRPVLFVETAALARIFDRDVSEFLTVVNPLSEEIATLRRDIEKVENRLVTIKMNLEHTLGDLTGKQRLLDLAVAMKLFEMNADSGALRHAMDTILARYGGSIIYSSSVFSAVGIHPSEIQEADKAAITESLEVDSLDFQSLTREQLQWEDTHYLGQMAKYNNGEIVDEEFLAFVRDDVKWKTYMSQLLTDIIIEHVSHLARGLV